MVVVFQLKNHFKIQMAKGFIDPPQGEEDINWSPPQDGSGTRQSPQVSQPAARSQSPPNVSTPVSSPSPTLSFPPMAFNSSPLLQSQQSANISVEELHELAMQDSENNNVDENSNDQQYDRYANYHREFNHHQFVPDQSVRPRVRRQQPERDELDHFPVVHEDTLRRRTGSGNFSHRKNLSEGGIYFDATTYEYEGHNYPHLPNLNSNPGSDRLLPRLPNPNDIRNEHLDHRHYCQLRDSFSSQSQSRRLPVNSRGGGYGPHSPPPSEDITQGAQELLMNFTSDTLRRNHLSVPESVFIHQGFSKPVWSRAGQELLLLADKFENTEARRRVKRMAETVDMRSINMENFFQLCAELFHDGITQERIVALFTFVGDVAVYQVQLRGEEFLQLLMKWSLKYLVDHVCRWVQEAGGWVAVLSCGANALYRSAVFAFCVCGTIAAGVFIFKTLKDW